MICLFTLDFKAIYDNAKMVLPTTEDHEGAMTALFRLQDTYKVPSNMLAKGEIEKKRKRVISLFFLRICEFSFALNSFLFNR